MTKQKMVVVTCYSWYGDESYDAYLDEKNLIRLVERHDKLREGLSCVPKWMYVEASEAIDLIVGSGYECIECASHNLVKVATVEIDSAYDDIRPWFPYMSMSVSNTNTERHVEITLADDYGQYLGHVSLDLALAALRSESQKEGE